MPGLRSLFAPASGAFLHWTRRFFKPLNDDMNLHLDHLTKFLKKPENLDYFKGLVEMGIPDETLREFLKLAGRPENAGLDLCELFFRAKENQPRQAEEALGEMGNTPLLNGLQ